MLRHLVVGAAVAATVTALTVVPAEAAAFGVTLSASSSKADVNKTFKLSGKVTGTGSAKKNLIIQRKIGSAAWKDFSTVKTGSSGTYAKTIRMLSVGAKQFRVLAPKTSKRTTGKSPTKTVTGYTWLTITQQPHETVTQGGNGSQGTAVSVDAVAKIDGKKYSHSVLLYVSDDPHAVALISNVGHLCDRFAFGYGLDDKSSDDALPQPLIAGAADSEHPSGDGDNFVGDGAPATTNLQSVNKPISSAFDTIIMGRNGAEGTDRGVVAVTTPKVHCSSLVLPESTLGGTIFAS